MLSLNRQTRKAVSSWWGRLTGKHIRATIDRPRTGYDKEINDRIFLTFANKSETSRFTVSLSPDDANWLVTHLISQGVTKVVLPANAERVVS